MSQIDINVRMLLEAQEIRRGLEGVKNDLNGVQKFAKRAGTALAGMVATAGGIYGVQAGLRAIISTGKQFESLRAELEGLIGSAEAAEVAFGWISDFAKETPGDLTAVADAFKNLKAFGMDPMDGTLQSITDQTAKLGYSQERLQGITRALGQSYTKMKMQAEEINQLTERGVAAWDILAEVTGKSGTELAKYVEASKAGRDDVTAFIKLMGEQATVFDENGNRIGAAAAQMDSLKGVTGQLGQAWQEAMNTMAEAGVLETFKGVLEDLRDGLTSLTKSGQLEDWGKRIARVMEYVWDTLKSTINIASEFGTVLAPIADSFSMIKAAFQDALDTISNLLNSINVDSQDLKAMLEGLGHAAVGVGMAFAGWGVAAILSRAIQLTYGLRAALMSLATTPAGALMALVGGATSLAMAMRNGSEETDKLTQSQVQAANAIKNTAKAIEKTVIGTSFDKVRTDIEHAFGDESLSLMTDFKNRANEVLSQAVNFEGSEEEFNKFQRNAKKAMDEWASSVMTASRRVEKTRTRISQLESKLVSAKRDAEEQKLKSAIEAAEKELSARENTLKEIERGEKRALKRLEQIRQQAATNALNDELALIDMRRRSMSEKEREVSIQKEITQRLEEASNARYEGDMKAAQAAIDRAKSLAQSSQDVEAFQSAVKEQQKLDEKSIDIAEKEAKAREQAKKKAINAVDEQINKIRQLHDELKQFEDEPVVLGIERELENARSELASLKDELRDLSQTNVLETFNKGEQNTESKIDVKVDDDEVKSAKQRLDELRTKLHQGGYSLRIDEDGNVSRAVDDVNSIPQEKTVQINADIDKSFATIRQNLDSIQEIEPQVNTKSVEQAIAELNSQISTIEENVGITPDIESAKQTLGKIEALFQNIGVDASVKVDAANIEQLKAALSEIAALEVSPEVDTGQASQVIDNLRNKIKLLAEELNIDSEPFLEALNNKEFSVDFDAQSALDKAGQLSDRLTAILQNTDTGIELDADASQAEKALVKLADQANKEKISIDADTDKLYQALDEVREFIEDQTPVVRPKIDTGGMDGEDAQSTIKVRANIDEAKEVISSLYEKIEKTEAQVGVTAETKLARDQLDDLSEKIEGYESRISPEVESPNFEGLKKDLEQISQLRFSPNVDKREAQNQIEYLQNLINGIEARFDVDVTELRQALNLEDMEVPVDTEEAQEKAKSLSRQFAGLFDKAPSELELKADADQPKSKLAELMSNLDSLGQRKPPIDEIFDERAINTQLASIRETLGQLDPTFESYIALDEENAREQIANLDVPPITADIEPKGLNESQKLNVDVNTELAQTELNDFRQQQSTQTIAVPAEVAVFAKTEKAQDAINQALSDLDAQPIEIDANPSALKEQIQQSLEQAEIDINVGGDAERQMRDLLARIDGIIAGEDKSLEIEADTNQAEVALIELTRQIQGIGNIPIKVDEAEVRQAGILANSILSEPVNKQVEVDLAAAQGEIDALNTDKSISIDATLESDAIDTALTAIEAILNELSTTQYAITLNLADEQATLDTINQIDTAVSALNGSTIGINADINTALQSLEQLQAELDALNGTLNIETSLDANTALANAQTLLNDIEGILGNANVVVNLQANLDNLDAAINNFSPNPISITTDVDTDLITASLDGINADPITVPINVDTEAATNALQALTPPPLTVDAEVALQGPVEAPQDVTVALNADTAPIEAALDNFEVTKTITLTSALDATPVNNAIDALSAQAPVITFDSNFETPNIDAPEGQTFSLDADIDLAQAAIGQVSDALAELGGQSFAPSVDVNATGAFNAIDRVQQALAEIKDKTVTVTVNTVQNRAQGGPILHAAQGSLVPGGYGGGDRVPAMLEPGEWIWRKEVVKSLGEAQIQAANSAPQKWRLVPVQMAQKIEPLHFSQGGPVSQGAPSANTAVSTLGRYEIELKIGQNSHRVSTDKKDAAESLIDDLKSLSHSLSR